MNHYINYMIESNLGLVSIMAVYGLLLRTETNFSLKRSFLLLGILASLLFPLIKTQYTVNALPSIGEVVPTQFLPAVDLENVVIAPVDTPVSAWTYLSWVYVGITAILFLVLLIRFISLWNLFRTSTSTTLYGRYRLIESERDLPTFSFFNYIFIGNVNQLSAEEKSLVITHEVVHARSLHSLDILLAESLRIIFWFNPIVYAYKSTFTSLHEFQADQLAVGQRGVNVYCGLLARVALRSADFPLANYFNTTLTVKRIAMLNALKTKMKAWKMAAIIPFFGLLCFVIACQDQLGKENLVSGGIAFDQLPPIIRQQIAILQKSHPTSEFIVVQSTKQGFETIDKLRDERGVGIMSVVDKNYVIVELSDRKKRTARLPKNESEIFDTVEETATPLFGLENLNRNVSYVLQYPEESRAKGKEGKVILEFVVGTNGKISDLEVAEGINEEMDTEAMRVFLQVGSSWIPAIHQGEVVRQRMKLPIVFSLAR